VEIRADCPRTAQAAPTKQAIRTALEDLTGPFKLKARVQTRTRRARKAGAVMLRQRLRTRRPTLALIRNLLVFVLACALVFYGAVLALLAFQLVSADTLNDVSAYRIAYDYLAGLQEGDIGDTLRLVAGIAGVIAFLLFAYLAFKQFPRPYLARHQLELADRGSGDLSPRRISCHPALFA
jgi:hypothetical protein